MAGSQWFYSFKVTLVASLGPEGSLQGKEGRAVGSDLTEQSWGRPRSVPLASQLPAE